MKARQKEKSFLDTCSNFEERITELERITDSVCVLLDKVIVRTGELIEWKNEVPYCDVLLQGDEITFRRSDGRETDECPFCGQKIETKSDEDCGCSEKN